MTLDYTLTQEDFLTYQLYTANHSERIQKKRKKARYIVPIIYLVCAYVMYLTGDGVATVFIALAIIWFLVYPTWTRYRYKKHYQSFVKEQFKNYDNRIVSLTIDDDFIYTKDEGSESKITLTEIQEISELPTLFLIKIKTAQSLVISKAGIDNSEKVKLKLESIAERYNTPYHKHLDWKWK